MKLRFIPSKEILLNKTDIFNINLAKPTWTTSKFAFFFICILKASILLAFFNLSGKMFQILGPMNETLSDSLCTVLIEGMAN